MTGIILRGPTGVGKSTAAHQLLSLLGQPPERLVNLDRGWADGEYRCTRNPERYHDLRGRNESVLVIELANGEPWRTIDEFLKGSGGVESGFWLRPPGPGATVGLEEWVALLRSQGRRLNSFLLSVEWQTACARRPYEPHLRRWHDLYKQPEWVNFASTAGIPEERIRMDTKSAAEIARYIYEKLGLAS